MSKKFKCSICTPSVISDKVWGTMCKVKCHSSCKNKNKEYINLGNGLFAVNPCCNKDKCAKHK